jgi:hypothetical protein
MNKVDSLGLKLGKYLASTLLETEARSVVGIYPTTNKPPHKGNFEVARELGEKANQVVVLITPDSQGGVTADHSVNVWNLYKDLLPKDIEVDISSSTPMIEILDIVRSNPKDKFIIALSRGEMERYKGMHKYPNVELMDASELEDAHDLGLKNAINNKDKDFEEHVPEGISIIDFLAAIDKQIQPELPKIDPRYMNYTAGSMHESQPEASTSPYQDLVLKAMPKIEKTSETFNIPIPDIQYAFETGNEVVLSDEMWENLQNSKSYKMKTLDDAIQHSLKLGIDPKPYIDAIKSGDDIPLPLVLNYNQGYWLVGGEVILSIYRALGSIPTVLQGNINMKMHGSISPPITEGKLHKDQNNTIHAFLKFAIKELGLKSVPKLTISHDAEKAKELHTFGYFDPNSKSIWLYFGHRVMADALRTLAHELVHRKQDEEGRIEQGSGETGSEIENEANAQAGVLLRKFGQQHTEIYEAKKKFGNYLFGDKESGVDIKWYDSEKEIDTPAERALFNTLKKYVNSESSTYSNINLDSYIPIFKQIKREYPEIGDPKIPDTSYIYRGTAISKSNLQKLLKGSETEFYKQGEIILNQEYSSKRKVQSWSTDYYTAATFAVSTAERNGGEPAVMRAKAGDADLYFNPNFITKLSLFPEKEVFNITNPIKVDVMVIENYNDEFEDM